MSIEAIGLLGELRVMLTIEDCIALSGLSPEEVTALAEHEHMPEIAAAELGQYLVRTEGGRRRLRAAIRDDLAAAMAAGDSERIAALRLALRHFLHDHMQTRATRLLGREPELEGAVDAPDRR
jgi:hypothetical protein